MARPVLYRIIDQPDGRFDVMATLGPNKTFTREGLASFAEVNAALDVLRAIMAACGAEVLLDPASATIPARADVRVVRGCVMREQKESAPA